MFGIGAPEMALIALLAIIFIGPSRIPTVARTIGNTYREFQKAVEGLKDEITAPAADAKREMEKSIEQDEIRRIKQEIMEVKGTADAFRRKPLDTLASGGDETESAAPRSGQIN